MIDKFRLWLEKTELVKTPVQSYLCAFNHFVSHYGEHNRENLLANKGFLIEHIKPQTVFPRHQGINKSILTSSGKIEPK